MPRGKLACTDHSSGAIRVVFTYSEKKGAIVARADLRSDTHLRERPRTKIKPCHCAGTQIDPAIVRVYQIQPSHCAGTLKQASVAGIKTIACLLAGYT